MGRCEKNIILNARGSTAPSAASPAGKIARGVVISLVIAAACFSGCGKTDENLARINPYHVAREFFEAWKKKDWKALYHLTHPAFIQTLRMQKLSPEQMAMTDEELFVSEFSRTQRMNPVKTLKTYEIRSFSPYTRGDTTVWLDALINGRQRRIPLTLDGLSLKIDITKIEY